MNSPSPPELLPYLSTNIPLPHKLRPTLGTYLEQTSITIANIDTHIDQIERILDAKRKSRDHYKKKYEEHSRLLAPARTIPPEIWGVIFGFTLGDQPFGRSEYRTYGFLRKVCTTWRDVVATTPNPCRGLVVQMNGPLAQSSYSDEKGVQNPMDKLEPWLAIVSRNHPYHLVLGAELEDDEAFDVSDYDVARICEWIFTTVPTPTVLTITNSDIFSSVYTHAPRNPAISHLTLDFEEDLDRQELDDSPLENAFPCLKVMVINASISFISDFSHTGIQSLSLANICGFAQEFAFFLLDLPSLRELRIDSDDLCRPPEDVSNPPTPLIHPTLEILVAEGEDLLFLLDNITFPSLKYFGLKAWGLNDEYEKIADLILSFFQRCSLNNKNFTASMRWIPRRFIFDLLMHSFPRGTRLHLDIDEVLGEEDDEAQIPAIPAPTHTRTFTEIFCNQRLDDFNWLRGEHDSPGSKLVKLYMPQGALDKGEIEVYRGKLGNLGYILEILQLHDYKKLLQSSTAQNTLGWGG
ncbi:hypothetical protein BKA70DRAFT_118225 [Coprinopsis sp. MPI-PUGE-AT-0042]|nr:hypothetical protein BKA70DRAFT_118225 [Coprinopsis sp. MPI-PUGE-AT-0042]